MRSPRWLIPSLILLPSIASAQVFVPPPPPHVYIQQRIHWHMRRVFRPPVQVQVMVPPPPVWMAPAPPPVWVAPATPPPPVYYTQPPQPPVHIEPQQPIYVQPQPDYQQPTCCMQAPPPPPMVMQQPPAPVPLMLAQPVPAKPQWTSRLGLGASLEGVFNGGEDKSHGYGVLAQLRYRTSRHTALEVMGGYEKATFENGLARTDVPLTFGLLVPFLGPEHVFSPYLVVAGGLNFAQLHLVDSPDFKLDDSRIQGVGQLGGGFEVRLGQHLSLNTDARLEGRWNMGDADKEVSGTTIKVDGQLVDPLHNSVSLRLGVGATIYF